MLWWNWAQGNIILVRLSNRFFCGVVLLGRRWLNKSFQSPVMVTKEAPDSGIFLQQPHNNANDKIQTHFLKNSLTFFVFNLLCGFKMISAVNFNYKAQLFAIKINNVTAKRFLTVECVIHHATGAELLPKKYFTKCRVFSQLP